MDCHGKWTDIKQKKAATDAKRGKAWSKLSEAIMAAAKNCGSECSLAYADSVSATYPILNG